MSTATEQTTTRPFHETIVDAIQRCSRVSSGEVFRLIQLIKETKIPKGHDEIMTAIDEHFSPRTEQWAREVREVNESLMEQKASAVKSDRGI